MFIGSGIPEISWPVIPGPEATRILAMLFQLEQSQWWTAEAIERHQFSQIRHVLEFAQRTVPFYQSLYGDRGIDLSAITDRDAFARLPILGRRDVQSADSAIHSTAPPQRHGRIGRTLTSGSSGQPVCALSTDVTRIFWRIFTLRDHFWHRRDFSARLAAIRDTEAGNASPPDGKTLANWGAATRDIVATGPASLLSIQSTIDVQAEWLLRVDPEYVLLYPSTALALATYFRDTGQSLPRLREMRTFGEILEPQARRLLQDILGVKVVDIYSSQEVGYLALQCPDCETYHVQSENLLVEILDEQGADCRPGEVGRVVVTTLNNFAMPLIRYDLGDYAEVGAPCACGRGLPVLNRIYGRQRNMLMLPDGRQQWPTLIRGDRPEELPAIQQFQLIQHSLTDLELKVVLPAPLGRDEEQRLQQYLQQTLGYPFAITISRVEEIPRSPSGKYEEFRSELAITPVEGCP